MREGSRALTQVPTLHALRLTGETARPFDFDPGARYGPHMRRTAARAAIVAIVAMLASLSTGTADGRPAVDDLQLGIAITTATGDVVTSLGFELDFHASTDGGPQNVTLRFSLPSGLRFATTPTTAEGCQVGPPVVCLVAPTTNEAGSLEFRKRWGVVADAPGFYEVTASVEGQRPDPDTSNNTRTYRFEVRAGTGGGGGGGSGGGGAVAVSASAAKLLPARPKAGSAVVASVRVTRGGTPVRPTRVACRAAIAGTSVKSTGRAAAGGATCRVQTPRSAKGKRLTGSISFRAGGRSFVKRFAARLG